MPALSRRSFNKMPALKSDYVYRDGSLLASETPSGRKHLHLDHLGTPRLVTDADGNQVAYHVYYPFSEEATDPYQDVEILKFTGHERDPNDPSGPGDDLDYMHARFCNLFTGKFLSLDPVDGLQRYPPVVESILLCAG